MFASSLLKYLVIMFFGSISNPKMKRFPWTDMMYYQHIELFPICKRANKCFVKRNLVENYKVDFLQMKMRSIFFRIIGN
ncbi:unnamed protein product [Rhizophagus irregularis]|nr:unnamed protein product [Rhizophagus irregularis]